ncbi:MAG TPA: hypothetical protein VF013_09555 [Candidatus Limnocylindria bacterium]
MRFLTAIALAALLAACNAGASTPTENPLPTVDSSHSMSSMEPSASDEASGMANASPTEASCQTAFDDLDLADIGSMTSLSDLTDELDATIGNCPSLDEWRTKAEEMLPNLDLGEVEQFIRDRCDESSELRSTAVCDEVAS